MGNNKQGSSGTVQFLNDTCHHSLGSFLIQTGSRFIQQQDWSLAGQGECSEQPAALTSGETAGIQAEWRIELLRQLPDKISQLGKLQTMPNGGFLVVRMKSQEIVPQGSTE